MLFTYGGDLIFDIIISKLKDEIDEIEYEKYISKINFNSSKSKSNILVIEVAFPILRNWIKTKYAEKIAYIYEKESSIKAEIIVLVKNKDNLDEIDDVEMKPKQSTKIKPIPTFTFDNFVVGNSNKFAFLAAQKVAKKPGGDYNPLFIYGGSGLGKTHLLHAITNELSKKFSNIMFITSERFINDFMNNLRNQTMDIFLQKYRDCDALLIDDVQFLSKKEQTQETFFHTFNELINNFKQIVLIADEHPKHIIGFEPRLKSRFESGLIADIQPPEIETKIAIINKKCELEDISLSKDVVNYIAAMMNENVREIAGAINQLKAFSQVLGSDITLDFAKNILKDQIKETYTNISIEQIVEIVARELNIKPSEIKSKSRTPKIANARKVVIYLTKNLTPNSMPMIAGYFGMKDHSSVSHSIKKVTELLRNDNEWQVRVEEIKNKIRQQQ
jgi:chromosomal replication initiator protein